MEPSRPIDRAVPRIIGGFELLELLGEGAMGTVYRARQLSLDRIVALKLLSPKIARDAAFIERFQREARATARLNHPHIVQGIDVGHDEASGLWFFAMELVSGSSVGKLLAQRQRIPEKRALEIARDVTRALVQAQKLGIVHRDIKPDNILLNERGEAKLADLGLAKQVSEDAGMTQTGMAVGTPQYMSPEQAQGKLAEIDIRSDLYSLGATLFHLVIGEPPFSGPSAAVVMTKHILEKPRLPHRIVSDVSEGAGRLIARCLQKDPARRPQSAEEMLFQLERLLEPDLLLGTTSPGNRGTGGFERPGNSGASRAPRERLAGSGARAAIQLKNAGKPQPANVTPIMVTGLALFLFGTALVLFIPRAREGAQQARNKTPGAPADPLAEAPGPRSDPQPEGLERAEERHLAAAADSPTQEPATPAGRSPSGPHQANPPPAQEVDPLHLEFERLQQTLQALPAEKVEERKRLAEPFLRAHGDTILAARIRTLLNPKPIQPVPEAPTAARTSAIRLAEPPASAAKAPVTGAPLTPAAPSPAAYAQFSESFLELCKTGRLEEAQDLVEKAIANKILGARDRRLVLDKESLGWLRDAEKAVEAGLLKAKGDESLALQFQDHQELTGSKGDFQIRAVRNGRVLLVGRGARKGMEKELPLSQLTSGARSQLAARGLGEDAEGWIRRTWLLILAFDAKTGQDGAAPILAALEKAAGASVPEEILEHLRGHFKTVKEQARNLAAREDWSKLEELGKRGQWKPLQEALLAFAREHQGTPAWIEQQEAHRKLTLEAQRQLDRQEGHCFDFQSPESFSRFRRLFDLQQPQGLELLHENGKAVFRPSRAAEPAGGAEGGGGFHLQSGTQRLGERWELRYRVQLWITPERLAAGQARGRHAFMLRFLAPEEKPGASTESHHRFHLELVGGYGGFLCCALRGPGQYDNGGGRSLGLFTGIQQNGPCGAPYLTPARPPASADGWYEATLRLAGHRLTAVVNGQAILDTALPPAAHELVAQSPLALWACGGADCRELLLDEFSFKSSARQDPPAKEGPPPPGPQAGLRPPADESRTAPPVEASRPSDPAKPADPATRRPEAPAVAAPPAAQAPNPNRNLLAQFGKSKEESRFCAPRNFPGFNNSGTLIWEKTRGGLQLRSFARYHWVSFFGPGLFLEKGTQIELEVQNLGESPTRAGACCWFNRATPNQPPIEAAAAVIASQATHTLVLTIDERSAGPHESLSVGLDLGSTSSRTVAPWQGLTLKAVYLTSPGKTR